MHKGGCFDCYLEHLGSRSNKYFCFLLVKALAIWTKGSRNQCLSLSTSSRCRRRRRHRRYRRRSHCAVESFVGINVNPLRDRLDVRSRKLESVSGIA